MAYKVSRENIETLKNLPETGMGYQVIIAIKEYMPREYFVFNGQFAFEKIGNSIDMPERMSLLLQAGNFRINKN